MVAGIGGGGKALEGLGHSGAISNLTAFFPHNVSGLEGLGHSGDISNLTAFFPHNVLCQLGSLDN